MLSDGAISYNKEKYWNMVKNFRNELIIPNKKDKPNKQTKNFKENL